MAGRDCSISLFTTDILLRYKSEWDPRAHAHTKGGYLDGEIRVPKLLPDERVIMTLETYPAEDVDPLISTIHPCLLHVVRMGQGKRFNRLEPVPTKTHWRQVFEVVNNEVWVVNSTSSLDVEKDGLPRQVPATDVVTKLQGDSIILGSAKTHLNLVFLKPKRATCDATIGMILADRLGLNDEEEVKRYTAHFTGKKCSTNLMRIRLKVSFFNTSGKLITSSVSPQTVVDNGSKRIGCMDMYDAWPRRSCSRGGRKIMMISEYDLAEDVVPIFEVYDSAGNQRPSVENWIVQPVNSPTTMTIKNTTIVFLTPAQPNLRRIKESIGKFTMKLLACRRSDGFTSKPFNFLYSEHDDQCDHTIDCVDEVAKIENKTRAKPNSKKRNMRPYDRTMPATVIERVSCDSNETSSPSSVSETSVNHESVSHSITLNQRSSSPPPLDLTRSRHPLVKQEDREAAIPLCILEEENPVQDILVGKRAVDSEAPSSMPPLKKLGTAEVPWSLVVLDEQIKQEAGPFQSSVRDVHHPRGDPRAEHVYLTAPDLDLDELDFLDGDSNHELVIDENCLP